MPSPADTPTPAPRTLPHLPLRIGALAGGALAVVATFLPWLSVPDVLDPSRRLVTRGFESLEGIAALAAAVVVVVLVAMGGRTRLLWAIVPATVVVLVTADNLLGCLGSHPEPTGGLLSLLELRPYAEYGLLLALAGGGVALVCSLLAGRTTATPAASAS